MDVDVAYSGPLFNGTLDRQIEAGIDRAKVAVAGYGLNILGAHRAMFHYLTPSKGPGHPGYWESHLRSDNVGADIVLSDPVVYTEWLEGTGSRNGVGRFKGYWMWRRTAQQLNDAAADIAAPIIDRAIS